MRFSLRVLAIAVVTVALAASAFAQAKPDFSGKWVMDPASAPAPPAGGGGGGGGGRGGGRGGGAGFGQEFEAKQDAADLTITRVQGDQTVTAATSSMAPRARTWWRAAAASRSRCRRRRGRAASSSITTTLNFGGNAIEQKRLLSLEGGNLVIEQTAPGRDGGAPTTTKLVYKKG